MRQRYLRSILLKVFLLLFLFSPLFAWYIDDFSVSIFPETEGSILVEERIRVDFEKELRHGIYRDIPVSLKIYGVKQNRRFQVIGVKRDKKEVPYTVRRKGNRLRIRIGDPKRYVTGLNLYEITYRVKRGIQFLKDRDEIYWNVTGTEWEVPILSASCSVYYPEGPAPLAWSCYTGKYGESGRDCDYEVGEGEADFYTRDLAPLEGLTIALAFPKGHFKEPGLFKKSLWFFSDNYFFLIPPLTLIVLAGIWRRSGRDPELGSIPIRYEPPEDLTPGEAGTLLDERVDVPDITSTLIDLARKGYLKIIEQEGAKFLFFSKKDYIFKKTKEIDKSLKNHEIALLSGLFEEGNTVSLSSLKSKFYRKLKGIKRSIYSSLVRAGYFPMNPEKIRGFYRMIGILLFIMGFLLFQFFLIRYGQVWLGPMVILSGAIVFVSARFMPRKTKKGVKKLKEILGFKEFLERVESDRIKRMHEENPNLFYDFLPFALALGIADDWADAFKGLYIEPPGWYSSPVIGTTRIDAHLFTANLGNGLKSIGQGFVSSPRGSGSGGGGFSGGGVGGGGGGAW